MTSLVTLETTHHFNHPIAEETFIELKQLKHLRIYSRKGKWMRHLTNLTSLDLTDLGRA
jgi:hypothetical protein